MQCPKCNHPLGMNQVKRAEREDRVIWKCRNYKCQHTLTYDIEGNRLTHKRLTDEVRKEIFSLYNIGLTYKEIAEKVGFSSKTVWTEVSKEEVRIVSEYNKKLASELRENYGRFNKK